MKYLLRKAELYGEKSLSDLEILIVLFGKRNYHKIVDLYDDVLKDESKYFNIYNLDLNDLVSKYKLSINDSLKFRVICEFAKRFNKLPNIEKKVIKSAKDVNDVFASDFIYEKNEKLKLIVLNNKNIIKKVVEITNGKQDSVTFDIKSILYETIKTGYNKIILVHNHPGGDSKPSKDDIEVTRRIKEMSEIIGIKLLDHVIIGENEYTSIVYR